MVKIDPFLRGAVPLLALAAVCVSCEGQLTIQSVSGTTMGTFYDVTVESDGTVADTVPVGMLVEGELAHVEAVMSTYRPDSDVSRFSARRDVEPTSVDPSVLEVLERALEVSRASGGAFDPTVGPLVDAWGFGPSDVTAPDSATVASLLRHVDFESLIADGAAGTLAKTDPLTGVDLSGVAKGYAAERLARQLAALGYTSALVDVGGELRALGTHVDGRPWRVALEGPGDLEPEPLGTVDLVDEAVATSGDFRNFYEDDGVLYSHIIDPATGYPLPYRGFSVSVVHADGGMADAWATALTVLGPERGMDVADREGLAALFAWRTPEGLITRPSRAMLGRLSPF